MIRAVVRVFRLLPARLDLEWMRWAAREIHPNHPDVPYVTLRIAELEEQCK